MGCFGRAAERAAYLKEVKVPMLFLQGSKDKLADIRLKQEVAQGLRDRATLKMSAEADHSFHVLVRSGRTDEQVMEEVLDTMVGSMTKKYALHG
jgi:alpha/beta superfamily hydrolase